MAVDPLETICFIIFFPESRVFQIQFIQVFHETGESSMKWIIQKHPVLLAFFIPFTELADFISHKIQFFAWMCIHVHIQRTRLWEFVFIVAAHFLHDRCFAVNNFIVRQREQETGIIVVHHGECQFVIVFRTVFRCGTEVIQRIVHPSHIPFIIKTKAALIDRIGYFGERSGIFGSKNHRRMHAFQFLIHILQEFYSIEVDASCRIALPVDGAADCIHTDTIHMEFADPVVCTGLQEASGLAAGMHEVAASPFTDTNRRVRIFIKCGSIVIRKAISIYGKMNRNKIHQYADVMFVTGIDEGLQLISCSVSGSRTEKTGCLIAPGFITWIFIQRHDLQVVIAVFDQIWNQNINHFFIVIPVVCFVRRLAKRTKMNFVNVQRFFSAVAAALQPLAVFEFVF